MVSNSIRHGFILVTSIQIRNTRTLLLFAIRSVSTANFNVKNTFSVMLSLNVFSVLAEQKLNLHQKIPNVKYN